MGSHPATSFIHTEDQQLVFSLFRGRTNRSAAPATTPLPQDDLEVANDVPLSETCPALPSAELRNSLRGFALVPGGESIPTVPKSCVNLPSESMNFNTDAGVQAVRTHLAQSI